MIKQRVSVSELGLFKQRETIGTGHRRIGCLD